MAKRERHTCARDLTALLPPVITTSKCHIPLFLKNCKHFLKVIFKNVQH